MKRIKVEIVNQSGTQRKFAQEVGIHETTLSNIISGVLQANEDQKELIVKALGGRYTWDELMEEI